MPEWKEEIRKRLAGLRLAPAREAEIVEELAQHLEDRNRELLAGGLAEPEAHRMALEELKFLARELRSVERAATREPVTPGTANTANVVADLWQDFRYAWRILAKNPGFAAVAVLTLALGIGVNTTIFSLVSSVLLRKPPVRDPDSVMTLCSKNPADVWHPELYPVSAPDYIDWRAQSTSFTDMAAAAFDTFTLSGSTEPERVPGAQVSQGYFQTLGVPPMLGRVFLPGEDQAGHERVVVLGEDLWRRHFGGDPQVIGRTVKVNGDAYAVVGVMPSRLRMWLLPAELSLPLVFTPEQLGVTGRKSRFLSVFGRLKPGVDERQARAEMATIAQRLAASHPDSNKGWGANVLSLQRYIIEQGNTRTGLVFLMGTVVFVLLIACANLANLLLARNSARQREFAIRTALGAGRARLARQLLSECLLLSLAGGGLGLVLAFWGVRGLRVEVNWSDYAARLAAEISIDWGVLLFTLLVSVTAAMVFGLAPAVQISRADLNAGLKEISRTATAGREHHRLQNLLVGGEVGLSLVLLVAAGLFVKSFIEEMQSKPGMNLDNLLTASVSLSGPAYKDPSRQSAFFENALRKLEGLPQVQSAAVTSDLPFTFPASVHFALEGRPAVAKDEQPSAGYYVVSPGYFHTVQIPLLEGRDFKPSDNTASAPVAIVNEGFARKYFGSENALGRRIRLDHGQAAAAQWSEIVGVVGNVNEFLGQSAPRPHVYEPFLARPDASMNLVVRTRGEPGGFAGSFRRALWAVDKDQAVTNLRTMERVVQDAGQGDSLMGELMGSFAGMALLMAAIGIYGVIAYVVGRRTHEIGVRMALGARRSEVFRLVLRSAMSVALTGVAVGFLISLALPKLVAASFPGFHVHVAWIVAGTPLAVTLVALASCYLPARRASRVDPMVALRYE